MKLLICCSTIDLKYRLGCTPAWWLLFKALYETGNEVIVVPYLGDPVESPWWRTYPNPCSRESKLYNAYLDRKKRRGGLPDRSERTDTLLNRFAERYVKGRWEKHLRAILGKERDIDALLFINVPLNHIRGIPAKLRDEHRPPVAYYDGDMPTILPKYAVGRGFKFNYYAGADLSEYDAFFTNSKGVIPDLKAMGAREVHALYFAADMEFSKPLETAKTIDISFFGYGSEYREEWMKRMIAGPSKSMAGVDFAVGGGGFRIGLGKARPVGDLSYSAFRTFCCASRICLNITRWSHTAVHASSTARPFELAGFGACIVSQPYSGIEEWFEPGKELVMVESGKEAVAEYRHLLDDGEERERMGRRARERVLREHTFQHRARELTRVLERLVSRV